MVSDEKSPAELRAMAEGHREMARVLRRSDRVKGMTLHEQIQHQHFAAVLDELADRAEKAKGAGHG